MMMTDTIPQDDDILIPLRSEERRRLLPLSTSKVYLLVGAGELSIVKIGSRSFLRRGDIRRFVAAQTAKAARV